MRRWGSMHTMAPLKMRTLRIHLSRAVAWSCVRSPPGRRCRTGQHRRGGERPPTSEGLVRARTQCVFSHPLPPSLGVAPEPSVPWREGHRAPMRAPHRQGGSGDELPRSRDSGKERLTSTGNARSAALAVRRYLTPPYTKRKMPPKGGTPGSYQVMTSFSDGPRRGIFLGAPPIFPVLPSLGLHLGGTYVQKGASIGIRADDIVNAFLVDLKFNPAA